MQGDMSFFFFIVCLAMSVIFVMLIGNPVAPISGHTKASEPSVKTSDSRADEVLQSLIEVGATFYGASWCGYTKKQLSELNITETKTRGLNYVDCEGSQSICEEKGIDAFPTWEINGEIIPGYYPVSRLQEMTKKG